MSTPKDMRSTLNLFEDRIKDNPSVTYQDVPKSKSDSTITKVIARLKSFNSAKYTKLGRNLERIDFLERKMKELREKTRADMRELIQDLFDAEDATRTRVVETVSFIFQLTKDPESGTTVKYAKVLEELETHLTPELKSVMETLIAKHSSFKEGSPPKLSYSRNEEPATESVDLNEEGLWDKLVHSFVELKNKVMRWGARYDTKLSNLKAQVSMGESLEESEVLTEDMNYEESFGDFFRDACIMTNDNGMIGWDIVGQQGPTFKVVAPDGAVFKFTLQATGEKQYRDIDGE